MKSIFKLVIVFFFTSIALSCSEEDNDITQLATIKVINIINGVPRVIVKTGTNPIQYATTEAKIDFNAFSNFTVKASINSEVEVVSESDTLNPIYSESLNLKPGIHSLYLYGFSGSEEGLLIEDNVKQFTDSLVGVRFVNLSKTAGPIDIEVPEENTISVSGLDFQSASDYIAFPAKKADGSYTFEFRGLSGNLLSRFTLDPLDMDNINKDVSTKKNLTLVLRELDFGFPFGVRNTVIRINNY
ncbi:hypothetical protein Q4Q34_03780 [Flavivirga abyssicola]|uniref:hypothetical protein n=1 Tax=Flavivirga abyssicola TaxID=3063533 RepID=UPI0026DF4A49|nr:hypothetical protein [Flavivirga sp. MEBiC07777]WVK14149.1 hypothetical protein Q4Q34_03780 [Flavivirga sp. MEBiC07777]